MPRWIEAITTAATSAQKPIVFVAHSLGAVALAHAAPLLDAGKVKGALLVTPPSESAIALIPHVDPAFVPFPNAPLPFSSLFVASRTDPYADYEASEALARAWGARLVDAGASGHLNDESGHGPWPEGLMSFAGFLRSL